MEASHQGTEKGWIKWKATLSSADSNDNSNKMMKIWVIIGLWVIIEPNDALFDFDPILPWL